MYSTGRENCQLSIRNRFLILVICLIVAIVQSQAYSFIVKTSSLALADSLTASEPISFDLANGNVVIGGLDVDNNIVYSGFDVNGNPVIGTHLDSNTYFVAQSNNSTVTSNTIILIGHSFSPIYDVTISGINCLSTKNYYEGGIYIDALAETPMRTTIRLQGDNSVGRIHYATALTASPDSASLTITSASGDGSTEGSLVAFSGTPWSAAIGGIDTTTQECSRNIYIAGGTITATTPGSGSTGTCAIGGGGNGVSDITISGGIINATNCGTGATIGGGGGASLFGADGHIVITGGVVNATNQYVNGVAIGGGGSLDEVAYNNTTVNISGGTVTTNGYIGGGSSTGGRGGDVTVTITGGDISVNNGGICGGSSVNSTGGAITVSISGGNIKADTISGGDGINGSATGNVAITGGSVEVESVGDNTTTVGVDSTTITKRLITVPNINEKTLVTNVFIVTADGYPYEYNCDMYTDNNGVLTLWIPTDSTICTVSTSVEGEETTNTISTVLRTFSVIIPESITIDSTTDSFGITAQLHNFLPSEGLGISVVPGENGFRLALEGHTDITLDYTLYSDSANTISIQSGDEAASFIGSGEKSVSVYYVVDNPQYAGTYSDTLTFTIAEK